MEYIKENDYVIIYTSGKKYCIKVVPEKIFTTKTGVIKLSEIIGKPFGIEVNNNFVLKPTIEDIILFGAIRDTQIIYPKDNFFIVSKLDIQHGFKVFECGTGSGALALTLSRAVAPDGMVFTYEKDEKFVKNSKKNIEKFGDINRVKIHFQDIKDGIDEKDFDAAFLDVKEPWEYLDIVYNILKPSAMLGIIVPTVNQISEVIPAMKSKFCDIEIMELFQRYYKLNPYRMRPEDRMVGHTGYLIFGRKIFINDNK